MIFDQQDVGDYRIYGGAIEAATGGGYIATVVVNQVRNSGPTPREVFREDGWIQGTRWRARDAALAYAMRKGLEIVRSVQPQVSICRSTGQP